MCYRVPNAPVQRRRTGAVRCKRLLQFFRKIGSSRITVKHAQPSVPISDQLFIREPCPLSASIQFGASCQRLIAADKKPKVAITACRRKLLTILNAMIKTSTSWHPEFA